MQTEDELSLSDIFRAIWSRIWAIVAALVIGAAAGMGIAFLKYHNVYYYGTTIDYFVSSSSEDASGELVGNAYSESVLKQVKLLLDSDAFDRQDFPKRKEFNRTPKKNVNFSICSKRRFPIPTKSGAINFQ